MFYHDCYTTPDGKQHFIIYQLMKGGKDQMSSKMEDYMSKRARTVYASGIGIPFAVSIHLSKQYFSSLAISAVRDGI